MVKVRHISLKFDWKLKMSFSFHSETLGLKQHLEENPKNLPPKISPQKSPPIVAICLMSFNFFVRLLKDRLHL